jgi:hypothetical protein
MAVIRSRRCIWLGVLALLATSPAWANASWGHFSGLRPGIQVGVVVLTLGVETLVFVLATGLPWLRTAYAVILANVLSGIIGLVFLEAFFHPVFVPFMVGLTCLIEAPILVGGANRYLRRTRGLFPRPGERRRRPWLGLIAANVLSATLAMAYVFTLVPTQDLRGPRGARGADVLAAVAKDLPQVAHREDRSLRSALAEGTLPPYPLRRLVSRWEAVFDVAPKWAPWSQLRRLPAYEVGEVPEILDIAGTGRPLAWTGGPYLHGRRGIIFADGSYRTMSEREFRTLNAIPQPPPPWLTELLKETPSPPRSSPTPSR